MLKVIAASILGRKSCEAKELPKRVLARREIESLFHDEFADHAIILKSARKGNPAHA